MRVSVLPSPWDEFSVASRACPGGKRGQKFVLCRSWRSIHICNMNITDRSAERGVRPREMTFVVLVLFITVAIIYGSVVLRRPFSTTQSSYLSLSLTGRSSNQEGFRSLPTGSSTGSSKISNFARICVRVLKGYSTHRDATDDTRWILNRLKTHCNTGENELFLFPRVRRNYSTIAVVYYANSIAARRIVLSGDVAVNPGSTESTESQGALQNKHDRARPKSN